MIDPDVEYGSESGAAYHYDPMINVREIYGHMGNYRFDVESVGIRGYSLVFDEVPIEDGQMDQYKNSTDPDWP